MALGHDDGSLRESDEADERFLARLVARDERAFNDLVHLYERRVFAVVFRMLGSREEAEDLAQEVFVQIFKSIDGFRGDSKLSTWIYRVSINMCRNRAKYLRVRRRDQERSVDDWGEPIGGDGAALAARSPTPDELVSGREIEAIVRREIAQIDDTFRECLILRDVEGLGYDEIGEITGLAAGTVKSRIFRARAQLKERVERALGDKNG